MCGFVGGTDPAWDYAAGLAALEHRGPDAGELDLGGPVKVGFRRLKIIDLDDAANQPMSTADGNHWVVFNGEVYGYRRLRQELERRGHAFRTESDTEVVLNAFVEWGHDFVAHIDGMFAIAIWEAGTRSLHLYRDRPGIKPLYYFYDGRRFAFASELKAIEALIPASELRRDPSALYDFLSYRYVPTPKTLYEHCFKLPPAHRTTFDAATGRLHEPHAYWRLRVPEAPAQISADEAAEELRALVSESVADQMIADVPLGFFLSGGVDSSVVVASAAGLGEGLETFSIGFDRDEVSETPYAREVARLFGTDHHERILSQESARDLLPNLRQWFDEPFADESAMPTFLVSETARRRVTVVLTGDGGDEVFGGYRTYLRYERNARPPSWSVNWDRRCERLRSRLRPRGPAHRLLGLLGMRLSSGPELWGKIMFGMSPAEKARYRETLGISFDYDDWWHYREHWRPDLPVRTRLQYLDFHTYMHELVLTKVDRTSMAVSLEARVPLLARKIIEFSFALPEHVRYHRGELKGLLKHAYRGMLPDSILDRRKKGFGIPRYYLRDLARDMPIQEHVLNSLYAQART